MASTKQLTLTSSSSSADKIAANNDLLLQILTCLPVKSLMKFKCVSKHWLSLISNPHFSRRGFLPHSPCICGLFLQTCPNSTYQIDFINLPCQHSQTLPSVSYPPNTKILQSCNGLLLCCDTPSDGPESMYSVCNPTTRQCVTLPPIRLTGEIFRGLFLAFDPLKPTEYKVICVLQEETEQPEIKIEIYSSKTGNWKGSEARFGLEWEDGLNGGVFWNGGIHWYTDYRSYVYFDLDEEQFKEMPLPNPILDDWYQRRVQYFGESRGHLHLVEIYYPPSTQFDVWEVKRDYSGWFQKYRVDLDELVREYPGMIRDDFLPWEANHYMFEILCVVESEREGESYMVLHIPGNIIRYDFETRNVKKLCDFPPLADHRNDEDASNFCYTSGYQYIESLVRL